MTLTETMRGTTHRQYRVWMYWLEQQWNRPNRTDNYLIQIAAEVRRLFRKNPRSVKMEHMVLRFSKPKQHRKPVDIKEVSRVAKSRWLGWLKGKK